MFQWGNFKYEKEFEADGYTKLLCHLNWLQGWPSWDLEAKDSSFHGIAHTVYGAVSANPSVEGAFKGCAYFPTGSTNDYILYADDVALQITTNLTIECFFSASKLAGSHTIVDKLSSYRLYFTDGTPNVTLGFLLIIGGAAKTLTVTVPESSFYNTWNHIKVTYDGQYQRIYFNGVEKGNRAQTGLIDITANPLIVGRNYSPAGAPYKGFIDELRLSNVIKPFIGKKSWDGKTALSGTKVQYLPGGQSALKHSLCSGQEGQSRLTQQRPLILGGKTLLTHLHSLEAAGRSALSQALSSLASGCSKLAFFVFEANLSHIEMDSFKVIRRPLEELVNNGHFLYGQDYRAQSFTGAVHKEDLESQDRYGVWEKSFELKFVREAAMANEMAGYYFNFLKEVRAKIIFRTFLCGLHLEVGDHILVNYPLYNLTGEYFTVTKIKFLAGCGQKHRMDLVEVEANEG